MDIQMIDRKRSANRDNELEQVQADRKALVGYTLYLDLPPPKTL